MASPGLHIPLELTRIICKDIAGDVTDEPLNDEQLSALQRIRLVSRNFALAGAELLFKRVTFRNRNASWENRSVEEIASRPELNAHVKILELQADMRTASRTKPNWKTSTNRWRRRSQPYIPRYVTKFGNARRLELHVEGAPEELAEGHYSFIRNWIEAVGKMTKTLPGLCDLRYTGHGLLTTGINEFIAEKLKCGLKELRLDLATCDEDEDDDNLSMNIELPANMPQIERLCIASTARNYYTGPCFRKAETVQMPRVRELAFEGFFFGQNAVKFFDNAMPFLSRLEINMIQLTGPDWNIFFRGLASQPGLRQVSLARIYNDIAVTGWQASLEELRVSFSEFASKTLARIISSSCKSLRHLHLEYLRVHDPDYIEVMHAIKSCHALTQLCLGHVRNTAGESMALEDANVAMLDAAMAVNQPPTIRENWAMRSMIIDFDTERGIFDLGDVLRAVIARGGNQHACGSGCDRVYDQEGVSSLYPWKMIEAGKAQRLDVYQWDRKTGRAHDTEVDEDMSDS